MMLYAVGRLSLPQGRERRRHWLERKLGLTATQADDQLVEWAKVDGWDRVDLWASYDAGLSYEPYTSGNGKVS